jgi:hypothetical protein
MEKFYIVNSPRAYGKWLRLNTNNSRSFSVGMSFPVITRISYFDLFKIFYQGGNFYLFTENFTEKVFFLYVLARKLKSRKDDLGLYIFRSYVELDRVAEFNLKQVLKYYWIFLLPRFDVVRWKRTITLVPSEGQYHRLGLRKVSYAPTNGYIKFERDLLECDNLFLYSGALNSRLDILKRILAYLPEGTVIKQHPNKKFRTEVLISDDKLDSQPLECFDLSLVRTIFFSDSTAVCNLEPDGNRSFVFISIPGLVVQQEIIDFVKNNQNCTTYDLDILSAPLR